MDAGSPLPTGRGLAEDILRLASACSHAIGTNFILVEPNPTILEIIALEAREEEKMCVSCLQVSLLILGYLQLL